MNSLTSERFALLTTALLAVVMVFAGPATVSGQQITGSLTGTVEDESGAVIPGAEVVLVNDASGTSLRTQTNEQGYFTVAGVFAGTYTIRVTAEGFSVLERTNIVFRPGDKRNLSDLVMQIGSTTETVTVTGEMDTITPVDSGEQSTTVTAEQLQSLAVVGRSAAEFIKIIPGMAPTGAGLQNKPAFSGENIGINGNGDGGQQSALGYFSANGQRGNAMDIVTDGANTADPGCNCATPVNPNVDMMQEFKVLTGTYSAEHAKGPVVMNAVTKGGGKDFHGGAYYYLRDYRMNANEWALNRAGQERPKNRYQFPGGNIGGPVSWKGFNEDKTKLFFFTGFEFYKQRIDTGVLNAVVPDAAMRQGDFSNSAYLQSLRSPDAQVTDITLDGETLPNGIIPQSRLDPRGLALQKLLPDANVNPLQTEGFNYVDALVLDQPMYQWNSRVDLNISDYTRLFVRYNRQKETQNFPVQLWGRSGTSVPYPTNVVGDNVSQSISASLINTFSPTMTNEFIFGFTFINFPNRLEDPDAASRSAIGLPVEGIYDNGVTQVPNLTINRSGAVLFNRGGFDPVYNATKWLTSAADNLSWFRGSHSMKFGFYWQQIRQDQPDSGASQGTYTFQPNHGLTSGNAYSDLALGIYQRYAENNINADVTQAYNVWEGYLQDSWKMSPSFTFEYGVRLSRLEPWRDVGDAQLGFGVFDPSKYDPTASFADLTGFRYNAIDSSVPKGGFATRSLFVQPRLGFAWDLGGGKTILRGGAGVFRFNTPTCCAGSYAIAAGQRSTNTGAPGLASEVDAISPAELGRTSLTVVDPNDDNKPTSYNWSFEVARRLPERVLFTAAYVGNASRKLLNGGVVRNANAVPVGAMLDTPNANSQLFRPYQLYSDINVIRQDFYSNYHSLQTSIRKQAGNFNIQASYTFSKVLGIRNNGASQADGTNRDLNYGVLEIDRTHIFSLAYNWELGKLVKGSNAFVRGAANGWQISGITTASSGVELASNDTSNFEIAGFLADGSALQQTAITGTPNVRAQPFLTCDPREGLGAQQFINGACFAPPTPGHNGDIIFPYLRSPALINHDLSFFKNFNIDESRRLQFRFSAYNFLNHPLWTFLPGDSNLNLNFNQAGEQTNSRFGYTDNKIGKRIIQLAIKFYF